MAECKNCTELEYCEECYQDRLSELEAQVAELEKQLRERIEYCVKGADALSEKDRMIEVLTYRLEDSLCHEQFTKEQWKQWAEAKAKEQSNG